MATKTTTETTEAREYIAVFRKHTMPGTNYVETNAGRIQLNYMTDDEALFVASEFKRLEIEAANRRKEKHDA